MKRIVCIILSICVILLPAVTPFVIAVITPAQFDNTFVGALSDKVERLSSVEGEKVVIVGGSSVAFGIDSALIEEEVGMPVVNFGLYAAVGTRAMLELSRPHIGRGDIVIVTPEMDSQTLSMYFSSDMMLRAMDSDYSLALGLSADSKLSLLGGMWRHAIDKLEASRHEKADPEGVYNRSNFNEYGDIEWVREGNIMPFSYDPNNRIRLSPDIVSPDFVEYLNEYTRYCRMMGAEVYFTFPPMNERGLSVDTDEESIYALEDYLESALECEVRGFASTYIMDAGYFYDTNYHLNDVGVIYRTRRLIEDVFLRFCEAGPDAPLISVYDPVYTGEDDPNAAYFTYKVTEEGALGITGLTELGKSAETLTVPFGVNGLKVFAICEGAFSEGVATTLIVPEESNLRTFFDGCMDGSGITDIWIYYNYTSDEELLAPASDFGGVYIHVPPSSLYLNQYAWLSSSVGYEFVPDAIR